MARKDKNQYSYDRVEKSIVRYGNENFKACGRVCQKARRVINRANYIIRNEKLKGDKRPNHRDADKMMKKGVLDSADIALYKKLPSGVAQRMTQIIGSEWKGFFEAIKEYKANPDKFEARPKPPGYARRAKTTYIPRNSFSVKDGFIHFAKALELKPVSIQRICDEQVVNAGKGTNTIKEVRIVPTGNCYQIEVVYDRLLSKPYSKNHSALLDRSKHLFIDIGLNNLACLVSDQPDYQPVLINGRTLKHANAKYNKEVAKLRSLGKQRHIKAKSVKRHCYIRDYLHRASRFVVNQCLEYDLGKIIIGHSADWKQSINMGKKNNQKFVSIPHAIFVNMVNYKAMEYGIQVVVREESYTSKASAIDIDFIPTYGEVKEKPVFSGRRTKRGLYKTKEGLLINADVNGCLNIGRKEIGDDFIKGLLDSGCVFQPMLITLNKSVRNRNSIKKIVPDVIHHQLSLVA